MRSEVATTCCAVLPGSSRCLGVRSRGSTTKLPRQQSTATPRNGAYKFPEYARGRDPESAQHQRLRFSVQFSSNVSGVLAFSCGSPSKIRLPSRVTSIKRELASDRPPSSTRCAPWLKDVPTARTGTEIKCDCMSLKMTSVSGPVPVQIAPSVLSTPPVDSCHLP